MAKQTSLFLPAGIANAAATLINYNSGSWVTVYTASANDAVVKSLAACSVGAPAATLMVAIDIGGGHYPIGAVTVPTGAGTDGVTNAIDCLNAAAFPHLPTDRNGKRCLPLKAGNILKVAYLCSLANGQAVTVVATAEEY